MSEIEQIPIEKVKRPKMRASSSFTPKTLFKKPRRLLRPKEATSQRAAAHKETAAAAAERAALTHEAGARDIAAATRFLGLAAKLGAEAETAQQQHREQVQNQVDLVAQRYGHFLEGFSGSMATRTLLEGKIDALAVDTLNEVFTNFGVEATAAHSKVKKRNMKHAPDLAIYKIARLMDRHLVPSWEVSLLTAAAGMVDYENQYINFGKEAGNYRQSGGFVLRPEFALNADRIAGRVPEGAKGRIDWEMLVREIPVDSYTTLILEGYSGYHKELDTYFEPGLFRLAVEFDTIKPE